MREAEDTAYSISLFSLPGKTFVTLPHPLAIHAPDPLDPSQKKKDIREMKTARILALVGSLAFLAVPLCAQTLADVEADYADPLELRSEAERLIRETASITPNLASGANRVSVYLRLADLAWNTDREITFSMLAAAQDELKRYLNQLDLETNAAAIAAESRGRNLRSSSLGSWTSLALSLRRDVVRSLARYVPDSAGLFMAETLEMVVNPELRSRIEREGSRLERDIAKLEAANDADKALAMGEEKLKTGVTSEVVGLASSIYSKDRQKGADYSEKVIDKLGSTSVDPSRAWILSRFFISAIRSQKYSPPMLDESGMKVLARAIEESVMAQGSRYTSLPRDVLDGLDRYSSGASTRISNVFEQRIAERRKNGNGGIRIAESSRLTVIDTETLREDARRQREDLNRLLGEVSDGESDKEARLEAIETAKESILTVNDDRFRYSNLAGLAVRAFRVGAEEEAIALMREAEAYLKASPKDRNDYSASLTIANAYAIVEPNRAFLIYEDMAYRLNGVIDGYVRFAEYSGNGRGVENGELVLNRSARQFTRFYEFQPDIIKSLAASDSRRLTDISNRFDRPEVRAETKLLLIASMLKAVESM